MRKPSSSLQSIRPPMVSRLLACRNGAVAIEFALIVPTLLAFIIAIIQVGLLSLAQQSLETLSEDTARRVFTGQSQKAAQSSAQFKASACSALPPILSCNNLFVDVKTVSTFSSANTGAPTITYDSSGNVNNNFNYTTGTKGSIVVLRLMYMMPVADLPFGLRLSNQPGSKRLIIATSVFKNEVYS